ncbi:MAG: hypothetical protein V5A62_08585 [Haloarculaceae archaeon]
MIGTTDLPHITARRTAFGVLLVAALLTTAVVGTTGTAAAALDGEGDDVCPCGALSIGSGTPSTVEVGHLDDRIGTLAIELTTDWFRDLDAVVLATPSPN